MLRTILVIIASLIIIIFAIAESIGPDIYGSYLLNKLKPTLSSQGIILTAKNSSAGLIRVNLREAELFFKRVLIGIKIDSFESSAFLSIPDFLPSLTFKGGAYEGNFEGAAEHSLTTKKLRGGFAFHDLSLKEHPQLAGFGITSGLFSGCFNDLLVDDRGLVQGNGTFEINNLDKPEKTMMPIPIGNGSLSSPLPSIRNLNVAASFIVFPSKVSVDKFLLKSSLGSIDGRVSVELHSPNPTLNGEFLIHLENDGLSFFGQFLPLLGNPEITEDTRDLAVSLLGEIRAPKFQVSPTSRVRSGFRELRRANPP